MKTNKSLAKSFFQEEVDDYQKEFYESGYRTFMNVRLDRFVEEIDLLNLSPGSNCLDAGCGPGYLSKKIQERELNITSLDSSQAMLELTKELLRKNASNNFKPAVLINADIEDLPFEELNFELIASAGVLEYLSSDYKILSEFYRVLKPGGTLIISSTNKISPIGYFEFLIESIKRNNTTRKISNKILSAFGGTPVRARGFKVRKHTGGELKKNVEQTGFKVEKIGYFYALPFPHPFDRVFPNISNYIGLKLEKLSNSPFKYLFEGIYIVASK